MTSPYLTLTERLIVLDDETDKRVQQFPNIERHRLAASMREASREMHRTSIIAWKRKQKSSTLFDLDVQVELFRRDVRKAYRKEYINEGGLKHWMQMVNDVGRSVGGWIKHEVKTEQAERARKLEESRKARGFKETVVR